MSRPIDIKGDVCADVPPGLIGSIVPMLWTFELKPCVSAVKLNAERAADVFLLNAHATIVYIYIVNDSHNHNTQKYYSHLQSKIQKNF